MWPCLEGQAAVCALPRVWAKPTLGGGDFAALFPEGRDGFDLGSSFPREREGDTRPLWLVGAALSVPRKIAGGFVTHGPHAFAGVAVTNGTDPAAHDRPVSSPGPGASSLIGSWVGCVLLVCLGDDVSQASVPVGGGHRAFWLWPPPPPPAFVFTCPAPCVSVWSQISPFRKNTPGDQAQATPRGLTSCNAISQHRLCKRGHMLGSWGEHAHMRIVGRHSSTRNRPWCV